MICTCCGVTSTAAPSSPLARDIAAADADEFRNQYPAYHADIAGETHKALDALRTDPVHRERYDRFVAAMVYGERVDFDEAMRTVTDLAVTRGKLRKRPTLNTSMPVIAPALRMFAPELWGEVDKFRHFLRNDIHVR